MLSRKTVNLLPALDGRPKRRQVTETKWRTPPLRPSHAPGRRTPVYGIISTSSPNRTDRGKEDPAWVGTP